MSSAGANNMLAKIKLKRISKPNQSKSSKEVLTKWFLDHSNNPYPTLSERKSLAEHSGLSITQVNNWFENATVESLEFKLMN